MIRSARSSTQLRHELIDAADPPRPARHEIISGKPEEDHEDEDRPQPPPAPVDQRDPEDVSEQEQAWNADDQKVDDGGCRTGADLEPPKPMRFGHHESEF